MTSVAYGIALPAGRGVLHPGTLAPPLDQVSGVTISAAWGLARPMLSSFSAGNRGRVRDTTTAGESDFVAPADATSFLAGDAGAVETLYDHSGNGRALTQSSASLQPAFSTSVGPNARAGAALDNSDDTMATAANMSAMFTTSSWYWAAVVLFNALNSGSTHENAAVSGDQLVIGNRGAGYLQMVVLANGKAAVGEFGTGVVLSGAGAVVAGAPVVLETRRSGGATSLRVNGASWIDVTMGDPTSLDEPLTIGKCWASGLPFNGAFLEGYVASAEPAQSAAVVANMKSYYGIP